ncbi:hypothetical protein PMKS-003899 [Pichia membranifaciens]|uniref:Histone transcription regulator 3 homolog n=1 Tax=Pichia membranifaciens TaxID=4926 RepID=A0A1Q2YLG1_9ASCO|nr:hypothetical protein PMKS-003899 [Pichia membranifaciens]
MLRLRELIDQHKSKQKKAKHSLLKDADNTIASKLEKSDEKNESLISLEENDLSILEIDSSESGTDNDDDELEISAYGEIIGSINDLLNATVYGIPDVKIIQILSSLFNHFGHPRLARLCYEIKLNTSEDYKSNDDLKIDLNKPEELLFNQVNLLENFLKLLDEISDNTSPLYKKVERCLHSKRFWNEIKLDGRHTKYNWNDILTMEQWDTERLRETDSLVLDITVVDGVVDMSSFFEEIISCVPKPKGKSRLHDGYYLTKSIFGKVEFDFDIDVSHPATPSPVETHDKITPTATIPEDNVDVELVEEKEEIEAKDIVEPKAKDVIASRATRSARTKSDVDPASDPAKTRLKDYDLFISQTLPSFLKLCDINLEFQPLSKLIYGNYLENIEADKIVSLFYSCVASWEDEYTQCLNVTDEKRNKLQTKSTSTPTSESESIREIVNLKSAKVINPHLYKRKDMTTVFQFLQTISKRNLHFNQVRVSIVKLMFKCDSETGASILCVEPMNKKTIRNFKSIVDCVSMSFYNEFEYFTLYELNPSLETEIVISAFNNSESIFEILVDSYVEFIHDQKLKKTSTYKHTLTTIQNFENTIVKRIEKWRYIIEDAFAIMDYHELPQLAHIWSRFVWFKLYYLQSHSQVLNPQELTDVLSNLSDVVKEKEIYLPFVNYELIPVLNYENIQTQASKLKILEIFDKNKESSKILESVLLKKKLNYSDNDNEIQKIQTQFEVFVESSNLPLKLRLWSLLLRYYRMNNDILKYKNAFEHIIAIMVDQLKTENLNKMADHQAKILLFNVIGFFSHFSHKFITFCNTTHFECFDNADRESSLKMVSSVAYFLYMLYSFLMYQNAVQIDSRPSLSVRSSKAFEILNNCVSSCFFLLAFYYPTALTNPKPEFIGDFLSICHIELGLLHMCSTDDGTFLKYLQYKLTALNFDISANDVFQIVHCRFGLSVSLDGFETFDHKCKPKAMTIEDTIQLSKFVSTYCFKGKHPVISPPRNDIKSIIDKIVDVVGDPDLTNPTVGKNKKILDSYLRKTNISLQFVINNFQGNSELNFEKPDVPGIEVAENGLYYIEGLIGLHFFKVRRRTMQSRAAELDYVLKMLENDILCGCNRFETWVALGQTYSFLVEDDLIWTADKLNSVERKQMTSLTQKKALLCYFMAICVHISSSEEEKARHKLVVPILWETFAKELYGTWMEPMNKKAFHIFVDDDPDDSKAVTNDSSSNKIADLKSQTNNIPNNAVFKLLELAFKSAVIEDETNWYDIMYLAKSQCKLKYQNTEPKIIIENFLKSCDLAMKQSSKDDPIIEPHYYLFSVISKYYQSSKITLDEAIGFFNQDPLFATMFASDISQETFNTLTFKVLNKIINYDRKNWQHRPVYRLARSYYDMDHDIESAKKELLSLINLKPNIRSLSTIWKPTSERPGKHFIYNSIYTQFLVQLLYEKGDIYSLTILLKKMRRAGSIMVNLTKTFDNMMLRICILIKKSLNLLPGFLDDSISKLKFSDFTKYSAAFIEYLETISMDQFDEDTSLHLFFLSETQAFRKLATGFGATGLIDECYHSIYIKLFMPFLFEKLISDKNNGILDTKLLNTSKEFTVERLSRSKQSTPDLAIRLNKTVSDLESLDLKSASLVTNLLTDETSIKASHPVGVDEQLSEVKNNLEQAEDGIEDGSTPLSASDLSMKDRYSIINYLSFGKSAITGTPSKEKVKVARRDVSPFALKVVNVTQALVNSMKENSNDGENIDYKISGPLDNTEFEKAIVGVMVKETKENKEEREFDELISAHDRSFTETELAEFNQILENFQVSKLSNSQTKIETENIQRAEVETQKAKEAEMELQRLRAELGRDIDLSEPSADASRNVTPVPMALGVMKQNGQSYESSSSAGEYNPFASPLEILNTEEGHIAMAEDNLHEHKYAVEHEKLTAVKNLTESISAARSGSPCNEETRSTNVEEAGLQRQGGDKSPEKTPVRITQSVITSFFKVSPNKRSLSPSDASSEFQNKRIKENEATSDQQGNGSKTPDPAAQTPEVGGDLAQTMKADPTLSPSRRHSRRDPAHSTLIELGKSGDAKEQVDIKLRREHALLEQAESLSSSSASDSEQSVIVID